MLAPWKFNLNRFHPKSPRNLLNLSTLNMLLLCDGRNPSMRIAGSESLESCQGAEGMRFGILSGGKTQWLECSKDIYYSYGCFQKMWENPQMDGENNGSKPYEQMDDLG